MIFKNLKRHTEVYAGRSFLTADEIAEHRKAILESFRQMDKDAQDETIVYWLEMIRDRRLQDTNRNMEYELEIHNNKNMVELKTYVFKLIATGVLALFFVFLGLAAKDIIPLIKSGIIKFL